MNEAIQLILFMLALITLSPLFGKYMAKVFMGEKHMIKPVFGWLEKSVYQVSGIKSEEEMNWKTYLNGVLLFNLFGLVLLFLLQMLQAWLPLNTEKLPNVSWHLSFNTAASFITNTNWQSYSGENTLSYLVQMLGLTVQNFVSAATGIAVVLALIRGLTRKTTDALGNFWADMTRSVLYVLLPLAIILTMALVGQGAVQTFSHYVKATNLQGTEQVIPLGPAASQIAIKQLGINGGGFFNANSAHPFEHPTPLTNFLEILLILLIPFSLTYTFGRFTGNTRQGRALFTVMLMIFVLFLRVMYWSEYNGNPLTQKLGVNGSYMEGKEVRFGIGGSVLFAVSTTATSSGAVNTMHDSLTPLGGMVTMLLILSGEVIPGGVGSGLYTMLSFAIIAVFIAGLMIGRTPEYLGKKIEVFEMRMSVLIVLTSGILVLIFVSVALITYAGISSILNPGPHGLSEIL